MRALDAGVALGCVKARSGTPFRLRDGRGSSHLVLHVSGEVFELGLRGEWWQVNSRADALKLLDDLRGLVRLEPLTLVDYVLQTA